MYITILEVKINSSTAGTQYFEKYGKKHEKRLNFDQKN